MAPRLDGKSLTLITTPFNRGFGSTEFRSAEDLMIFEPASLPPVATAELPKVTRDIPPMSAAGATPVKIDLVMTKEQGLGGFALEGGPFWRKTSVRAEVGETQLWTITNKAIWAHPIHLHGFFFQEVDEKGVPVSPPCMEGHDPCCSRCDETFPRQARSVPLPSRCAGSTN